MDRILAVKISNLSPWISLGDYQNANTLISGKIIPAINYAIGFSALVAVIFLIIAGYTYITAGGDSDKVEKAGKTITAAIVGLIIIFVARVLVQLVLNILYQ